ncbi:MAG: DNA alkylation repair protein [Acidobacteria bacterium]|nr:DNA alkylation repair protein [Acidobacteriota bacterium]
MSTAKQIREQLADLGDPAIAEHSARFFKTGPGEYGEGDRFRGIRVPVLRGLAKRQASAPLRTVMALLKSRCHEDRLAAVLILVLQYQRGDAQHRTRIYDAYLANTEHINNWDLVDSSAHKIVGPHLQDRDRAPLYSLVESTSLWERRIAMMSTLHFIKQDDFDDALAIAELLLHDTEDLIHKIVGWMLREVGNRDIRVEEDFLRGRYQDMPRTMLRYAIEKFPEPRRRAYIEGTI